MTMCVERLAEVRREEVEFGFLGRVTAIDNALTLWHHDLYLAGFHHISSPALV